MKARSMVPVLATDQDSIVERCRQGDEDAWKDLVRRYSSYVYAIATTAYRLSASDAEDVFQEVFVRTWQQLDELRDDAAIRPWIGQVTRRLAIDRLRQVARERGRDYLEEVVAEPDEDVLSRLEEALAVRQAVGRLPTIQREMIERFYVRGESYATIAAALHIPEGTVASRICRARERLRWHLRG
jgi:RNA polymerase sigma-70 factor, ECF subfamily